MRKENLHAAVWCVLRKVVGKSLYYGTTLISKTWEALTTIYEGQGRARSFNRSAPKIPRSYVKKWGLTERSRMLSEGKSPGGFRGKVKKRVNVSVFDTCSSEMPSITLRSVFYPRCSRERTISTRIFRKDSLTRRLNCSY